MYEGLNQKFLDLSNPFPWYRKAKSSIIPTSNTFHSRIKRVETRYRKYRNDKLRNRLESFVTIDEW